MKKISKWNTLISRTAQVQKQEQKITCKYLGPYKYLQVIGSIK